ncbi:MAG: sigma-54-dependent Fis family transcriptional regulator [Deltaproteobacteria bacterium]|nr:sigma-54-dependent Fis family transcriptional regulator [Deltaproteobacteria bacterium]
MPKPIVLYVDDDTANLETFKRSFRFDYDIKCAPSAAEGLNIVKTEKELGLIITDQRMPQMTGIEFLKEAIKLNPHPQRIILTAFTDNEALLKAIQEGHVYDYIVKPWEPKTLKEICDKAIAIYNDRIEKIKKLFASETKLQIFEEDVKSKYNFDEIIGWNDGLALVMAQVKKVAASNATVLIRGETGTGKELIARAIHNSSSRNDSAFVAVHCAALSPGILESELFGHEKGAFTGAIASKKGRFELADGGTLFLDEIGDLPEPVQVKLLRILQERNFERVGGTETKSVDVRLITATHKPLEELVKTGKFRQDLFFRLNVIPISLPPLRERTGDIKKLIDHFLVKYNKELGKNLSIEPKAYELLAKYDWPGNVRELQNIIERAVVLGEETIASDDLIQNFSEDSSTFDNLPLLDSIKGEEAKKIVCAMKQARGNISEAARLLGIARSTLVHRLKKYKVL